MPFPQKSECGALARVGPIDTFGMSVRRHISCTRAPHKKGTHSTRYSEPVTNEIGSVVGAIWHEARWVGEVSEVALARAQRRATA